jgi:sugar (pentulose or hexulose) kinase
VTGGGTRSALWCQLVADCLGCPVAVPESTEATATGAAVLLAVSQGVYPSLSAAVDRMVTVDRRYEPRESTADQYAALYDLFSEMRREMVPVWSARSAGYDRVD